MWLGDDVSLDQTCGRACAHADKVDPVLGQQGGGGHDGLVRRVGSYLVVLRIPARTSTCVQMLRMCMAWTWHGHLTGLCTLPPTGAMHVMRSRQGAGCCQAGASKSMPSKGISAGPWRAHNDDVESVADKVLDLVQEPAQQPAVSSSHSCCQRSCYACCYKRGCLLSDCIAGSSACCESAQQLSVTQTRPCRLCDSGSCCACKISL